MTDLTANKITTAAGTDAIESDAMTLMSERARTIRSERVMMRVVFVLSRLAASYGDPSLADRGTMLEMTAKRSDLLHDGTAWSKQLASGIVPKGVAVRLQHAFPTNY